MRITTVNLLNEYGIIAKLPKYIIIIEWVSFLDISEMTSPFPPVTMKKQVSSIMQLSLNYSCRAPLFKFSDS